MLIDVVCRDSRPRLFRREALGSLNTTVCISKKSTGMLNLPCGHLLKCHLVFPENCGPFRTLPLRDHSVIFDEHLDEVFQADSKRWENELVRLIGCANAGRAVPNHSGANDRPKFLSTRHRSAASGDSCILASIL